MSQKSIVFLFRYGAAEHIDFLPALPALCSRLCDRGWTVEHLGFKSNLDLPPSLSAVCTVRSLPLKVKRSSRRDKWIKSFLWLLLLPWIGWRLQRRGVHTVFVDETLPLSSLALRLGYRGRLCFTIHDFFTEIYLSDRWWTRPMGKWITRRDEKDWRRLDRIFVRVPAAKDFLTRAGVQSDRIRVVPDSVDTEVFHPGDAPEIRASLGFSPEHVVLIHHGILHPNKGNVRFVEAFSRWVEKNPNLRLVLIGDGSEMPHLQKKIQERGLQGKVILTGWLETFSDLAEMLRAADIGLVMRLGLPGDHFHVTSTLVHNLSSGLPILSVRLRGLEESMDEHQQGFFFDVDCGSELEKRLFQLAGDEALRTKMGQSSRRLAVERYAPEAIADLYAEGLLEK